VFGNKIWLMAIKNITQVKLKGIYELGNFHLLIEALQNKIRPAVKRL